MDDQAYRSAYVLRADPVSVPSSVDLSADHPPPGVQGGQGSCVGWAVAYAMKTYQERIERDWPLTNDHIFSAAYVYNQIKAPRGGAFLFDAFSLLVDQGVASQATMPYNPNDDSTQPSAAARREAANYKIADWGVVQRTSHATFVREIKRHLAANTPVVIGIYTYPDFDRLGPDNDTYDDASGFSRGGHAIVIVGYDDAKSAFKIINSWGPGWGINGYGWIDYDASERLIRVAYVADDVVEADVHRRPGAASTPVPDNTAEGVAAGAAGTTLSWTRNERTTSFDVYVGTTRELGAVDFQGNVAQPTFRAILAPGSTYYWRIDARGAGGLTQGPVWSFTTAGSAEPPLKPTNPRPATGATAVSGGASLSWDSGGRATSYDVYLGTGSSLGSSDLQRTQATRTFYPGTLVAGTRYYWRIDAKNSRGKTRGDTWSFTTAGPARTLSIADARATEGQSLTFAVTLSAASASTVTVQYRTANGTASSSDYTSASGTLRFSAGDTRKTISVRTTDDRLNESDETITVTLSNANGATIADDRATGTITDSGWTATASSQGFWNYARSPDKAIDGDSDTDWCATRVPAWLQVTFPSSVSVPYLKVDFHYHTVHGNLQVSTDGSSWTTVASFDTTAEDTGRGVNNDATRTFRVGRRIRYAKVNFTRTDAPSSHILQACISEISISTSPAPTPTPSLSIADASATEGQSLRFAVTLSAASARTVTAQYRTANGTASSSDYTSASGTLRFSAGDTRKTISVRTTDDRLNESNETITVTLSNASGATISDNRATGTIIDNDADHGNSRGEAHVLSNCGSGNRDWTINGSLTADDTDYFLIECNDRRGALTAWTTGSTNTFGELQYADGARVERDEDSGSGNNFHISGQTAAVGTYYLKVEGDSSSTTGPYVLRVRWRPYDIPDSLSSAKEIRVNNNTRSYPGYLHRNDVDWFKFNTGSGERCIYVRIWSTLAHRLRSSFDTDPVGALFHRYDSSSYKLWEHDNRNSQDPDFEMYVKLRKSEYIFGIRVTLGSPSETGPYTLYIRRSNASNCSGALN